MRGILLVLSNNVTFKSRKSNQINSIEGKEVARCLILGTKYMNAGGCWT